MVHTQTRSTAAPPASASAAAAALARPFSGEVPSSNPTNIDSRTATDGSPPSRGEPISGEPISGPAGPSAAASGPNEPIRSWLTPPNPPADCAAAESAAAEEASAPPLRDSPGGGAPPLGPAGRRASSSRSYETAFLAASRWRVPPLSGTRRRRRRWGPSQELSFRNATPPESFRGCLHTVT
eukprot:821086-Pyramimonas_sp.AAC.1